LTDNNNNNNNANNNANDYCAVVTQSSPGSFDGYQAPGRRRPLDQADQLEPQVYLNWQQILQGNFTCF